MKRRHKVVGAALVAVVAGGTAIAVQSAPELPPAMVRIDPVLTPGVIDPSATKEVICNTSTDLRRNVSDKTKTQVFGEYHVVKTPKDYEVDHLIPLALGGSNDIKNLWPEPALPVPGYHEKDQLEVKMRWLMCSGQLPLDQAQHEIATDWVAAYHRYVLQP